jgi:hypothetical protein
MRKRDFRMVLTCVRLGGLEIRARLPSHPFLADHFSKLAAASPKLQPLVLRQEQALQKILLFQ